MSNPSACPNHEQLQALIDGAVSEEEQNGLTEHLDECAECRQRLEKHVNPEWTLGEAIVPSAQGSHISDALRQLMSNLKSERAKWTEPPEESSSAPPSLDFLSPAENRRHLGKLADYEVLEVHRPWWYGNGP